MHAQFADPPLAKALLPHAFDTRDAAHDDAHLMRVWANVRTIMRDEGGDGVILTAATILHDCVWVDKTSPERAMASRLAAEKARALLARLNWEGPRIDQVAHAIEAHSFSAGITPETLEASILQDADRLDAMGWIGVARCLAFSGERGIALYNIADPAARRRPLDDSAFALDHFRTKLMTLGDNMTTAAGRKMAKERAERLTRFYDGLLDEIGENGTASLA